MVLKDFLWSHIKRARPLDCVISGTVTESCLVLGQQDRIGFSLFYQTIDSNGRNEHSGCGRVQGSCGLKELFAKK